MKSREPSWRRYLRLIRPDVARDVDEELAFHLAMREAELMAQGATPEEARGQARDRFGDVTHTREACMTVDNRMLRASRRVLMLEELGQDLRFAARTLAKRPGFAAAVIVTLAIGIGATVGIFAMIDAILLQPPAAVHQPKQLVAVYTSDFSGPAYGGSSHPDYESFRESGADVFGGLAMFERRSLSATLRGSSLVRNAEVVSGNYFDVLGVSMQLGRGFTTVEDHGPGGHPVAVISDRMWRRFADADPNVIGQPMGINGQVYTVVGVAPPRYTGMVRGSGSDLWLPRSMADALQPTDNADIPRRDSRGIQIFGRLKDGVTMEAAAARLNVTAATLFAEYPSAWRDNSGKGRRVSLLSESDSRLNPQQRGRVVAFLSLLMGAVTLLLLLCGANVATLLVARGASRAREIAVRLSMGAGRGRLVRQLMTENLVLALAGGAGGLWVGRQVVNGMLFLMDADPGSFQIHLGGTVLLFALAVTLGTTILFGMGPAVRASRADVQRELKGTGGVLVSGKRRFAARDVLVAAQVALSLVLLTGAGLLLRSLRETQRVDVGFDATRMVLIQPSLGMLNYSAERAREYYRTLGERMSALPGVQAVTLSSRVPLGSGYSRSGIAVEGYERGPGEDLEFGYNRIESGYFRFMGIPLALGRDFSPSDVGGAPDVAIVNEGFAAKFWPGQNPLGRRLQLYAAEERWFTVVGVVKDIDQVRIGEERLPYFYVPYPQYHALHMVMQVRTAGDEAPVLEAAKAVTKEIDPELPVDIGTMQERLDNLLRPQNTATTLLTLLGAVGLLLAGTGLYGVLAFSVAQRSREFGIRMALGASAGRVRRMVVQQGVTLAGAGVVVGLAVAGALVMLAKGLLFGARAGDPGTFVAVTLLLLSVAALAAWIPARRATSVNPADVIRND